MEDILYTVCNFWWMYCRVVHAATDTTEEWEYWVASMEYTLGYMANWFQEIILAVV